MRLDMLVVIDGHRSVWTQDEDTGKQVYVEVDADCTVTRGFPVWFQRLAAASINGVTLYPDIALRDTASNAWSLWGFLHERGHWWDQRAFVVKARKLMGRAAGRVAGLGAWVVRYEWRMVWDCFHYHDEADEQAADALATRHRDNWIAQGCPRVYTLAMQDLIH